MIWIVYYAPTDERVGLIILTSDNGHKEHDHQKVNLLHHPATGNWMKVGFAGLFGRSIDHSHVNSANASLAAE